MPDLATLLPLVAALVVIGGFAGVIGGLLGVGGGIVLVPAFFYAFQSLGYGGAQLMQICVATSLATIVITSLRSLSAHNKKGAVEWSVLKTWGPWLVIASALGVFVAAKVSSLALQAVFGAMAGLAGLWMAFGRDSARLADQMPDEPVRGLLASGVGFFSAMMGIGGGTFGVPLMTLFAMPIHRAVATASGFGVLIAVPAVLGFLLLPVAEAPPYSIGAVNLPAFLVVIGTTLLTTPWGVKLAHSMNPKPLKRAFALFLTLVALNMLRKVFF
ncbi:sulfite exporter TauE/SafE family protein [Xinfangfangia sp. CPCC 101601]|uniref:Probable membrane transporter protein n=1 Tax=Pseudogemmobacter lacusdianii TaxID=3069608 RepID=A0ABU0VXZ9_9RHOB|nr:sulfite exporter TauE/SafE family protein [Xinfangfangia sp. CPCC 101601]MDQ2066635.1 sulfite exporter TauE/SafE family protein [Xinfangfangia sp. CPCC 101601]